MLINHQGRSVAFPAHFTRNAYKHNRLHVFTDYTFKIISTSPRGQSVKYTTCNFFYLQVRSCVDYCAGTHGMVLLYTYFTLIEINILIPYTHILNVTNVIKILLKIMYKICETLFWSRHGLFCIGLINTLKSAQAYIDGLVQDCSIASAFAMEILQYCTKL